VAPRLHPDPEVLGVKRLVNQALLVLDLEMLEVEVERLQIQPLPVVDLQMERLEVMKLQMKALPLIDAPRGHLEREFPTGHPPK
jgi:hypothetical protein